MKCTVRIFVMPAAQIADVLRGRGRSSSATNLLLVHELHWWHSVLASLDFVVTASYCITKKAKRQNVRSLMHMCE